MGRLEKRLREVGNWGCTSSRSEEWQQVGERDRVEISFVKGTPQLRRRSISGQSLGAFIASLSVHSVEGQCCLNPASLSGVLIMPVAVSKLNATDAKRVWDFLAKFMENPAQPGISLEGWTTKPFCKVL